MQNRHIDKKQYFNEQIFTTQKYVLPYIESIISIDSTVRILEIGCGEGGNLVPFLQRGCYGLGVDLNRVKIEKGKRYIQEILPSANFDFIVENIYNLSVSDIGSFDLIVMRDVIEHIHNQEHFLHYVKTLLSPKGRIFFGFPPWRMPFGGHQQICKSRILSKMPYFHLLPERIYKAILQSFGESERRINDLLEIKQTRISINRFEQIIKNENYTFDKKDFFLINPNYEVKFGLQPRKLNRTLGRIPYFKDFYTTCYYCVVHTN